MKTKLGIQQRIRKIFSIYNLYRFWWRKHLLGFDIANQFAQRVDKFSLQIILKNNGATIGKGCDIESGLIFHNCSNYKNLSIGNNCHIGKFCFFDLKNKVIIEDNVTISMQCTFITHQDMGKTELSLHYPLIYKEIKIYHDSYIGANATILMGVEIGPRSIIAAGALVNKTIPSNSIAKGVPVDFTELSIFNVKEE